MSSSKRPLEGYADQHGRHGFGSTARGKIEILPVRPGDVERISALAAEIWWHHYPSIISAAQIEYMLKQRYAPSVLRAELKRTDLWWDKLVADGDVVGFASYFLMDRPGAMKLDKLYVHPQYQRRGYGGMLLGKACARARAQGCSILTLAVNKDNRHAIAAYRKHGFCMSEAVVKDIGGGFVMDDYIMEFDLGNV